MSPHDACHMGGCLSVCVLVYGLTGMGTYIKNTYDLTFKIKTKIS